jgi:oligopeptidase B
VEGESIAETNGFVEWGRDSATVFYGTMDDAHRSNKVWRHAMGGAEADECLYTENDDVFSAFFAKTLSDRFLFIISASSTTSEYRYVDLAAPGWAVRLVAEREKDVLYSVDHAGGDRLLITTNAEGATNFKVMAAAVGGGRGTWTDFIAYRPERTILSVTSFETFSVVSGREGGFARLWIMEGGDPAKLHRLAVDEAASVVELGENMEFKTGKVRFLYSSMTTPRQTLDYDVATRTRALLKETPVPMYDRTLYRTERLEAVAPDGTKIPMSLVWNTGAVRPEGEPDLVHLYGYASYGISIDPAFSPNVLPLLDRGVVYAIAHCRGGGEGGRAWYEAARFETKAVSFSDFVACAELLVSSGRTTPDRMSMEGRSAGGLLMGAVMNARPDLFRAVIAGVPFVDVLNTMSDATIPLTTGEWEEWGDPNDCAKYFNAISGYCPYQNVTARPYPAALVVAGLHDPRVLYSEPAKWVAKLRAHSTSGREVLLKVDLESGHFSASDRYKYKRERAFELAWLLDQLGAPARKVAG